MFNSEYFSIIIIAATSISSFIGFSDIKYRSRHIFNVGAILGSPKQWDRLLSHAFLHGDFLHLFFNMFTLYFFSKPIIYSLGILPYLGIYAMSIIGGGLLSLWVHRKNYEYSALGASGGVVGILFAAIALNPWGGIGMLFIPVPIPGWIFGILYLAFSVYGMRSQMGNISHEGHLGGAIVGLVSIIALRPDILDRNGMYIGIMAIPLIILAILIWKEK